MERNAMNQTNYASVVVHCSSCMIDMLESKDHYNSSTFDWGYCRSELRDLILNRLNHGEGFSSMAVQVADGLSGAMASYLQQCIRNGYNTDSLAVNALNYLQSQYDALH